MKTEGIKALIVDDEKQARHLLRHYLESIPEVDQVEESASVEDALFKIIDFAPEVLFLDIMMPGRNGTELMELLEKKEINCHIIVVSGAEDAAISAIRNNVYDYLLKPLRKNDLENAVGRYLEKKSISPGRNLKRILEQMDDHLKIRLSNSNSYVLLDPADVVYCEAGGSYTLIYLDSGSRETANNYLGMIERLLSGRRFFRVSRSHLINLDKLLRINKSDHTCALSYGKKTVKIKVSRKQLKLLCEMDFE